MVDHHLFQQSSRVDFVIAEVKTHQPCSLNGPWTAPDKYNINHLLESIGPLPKTEVATAASALYERGTYENDWFHARLVAFGDGVNDSLRKDFPVVPQLLWADVLEFIYHRHRKHRKQKKDHDQWDPAGKWLYEAATHMPLDSFTELALP